MNKCNKFLGVILAVIMCMATVSCSKKGTDKPDAKSTDEIASKYDEIANDVMGDKPIDSGVSVFGDGFSLMDFTFTSDDDTVAFSLDNNSFAKLCLGGTFFNYISGGHDVVSYDAGFKTARGMALGSTEKEFLSKYNIPDENTLYKRADEDIFYNPANGHFTGKATVVYASKDSMSYAFLTDDDVQKFLSVRELKSDGTYMDPKVITDEFPDYQSIATMDITTDENGVVTEVAIYKFDR